jgi:hypothetical protein
MRLSHSRIVRVERNLQQNRRRNLRIAVERELNFSGRLNDFGRREQKEQNRGQAARWRTTPASPSRIRWMAADFGFEEIDVSRPKVRARRINSEILSHLI